MMNFQVNKKVSGVVKWFLPFYLSSFKCHSTETGSVQTRPGVR